MFECNVDVSFYIDIYLESDSVFIFFFRVNLSLGKVLRCNVNPANKTEDKEQCYLVEEYSQIKTDSCKDFPDQWLLWQIVGCGSSMVESHQPRLKAAKFCQMKSCCR